VVQRRDSLLVGCGLTAICREQREVPATPWRRILDILVLEYVEVSGFVIQMSMRPRVYIFKRLTIGHDLPSSEISRCWFHTLGHLAGDASIA